MEITVYINGKEIKAAAGRLLLEIAAENGIEIPSMCYDDRVKPYGSCGVCLVEIEGLPRLVRACSAIAQDGWKVFTDSERAVNNRKAALELLLSDHDGDCKAPCALACPAETDCQGYAQLVALGKDREAVERIKQQLPLPASIGRVCPHPCEDKCRRDFVEEPVSLSFLKYFAADRDLASSSPYSPEVAAPTGKKAAIIGGGPAGLTAAYFLRQKGHEVTIFDALPQMGGMLRYGIPEYRLPKEILDKEIKLIEDLGVVMKCNTRLGKDILLNDLRKEYSSVLIAVGAWTASPMRCAGEDLDGVYGGTDFLAEVAAVNTGERGGLSLQGLPAIDIDKFAGKNVAVVGGGNVAMDCCRTLVRLGAANVYNIYRRTRNEMPAEEIEIVEAEEEGVIFKNLTNPNEIVGENGKVKHIRLQVMELGEPDASGRRAPVAVEGKEEILEVEAVFSAIGNKVLPTGLNRIELTKWGTIIADEVTYQTNAAGVFAAGDAVNNGPGIAIAAIAHGKKAAAAMDIYMQGNETTYKKPVLVERDLSDKSYFDSLEKVERARMPHMPPAERRDNFKQVNFGFSEEAARNEAKRCLDCGCQDYHECRLIKYATDAQADVKKYGGAKHIRGTDTRHEGIVLNPDKCVLCGLCMRICEEVEKLSALGLVGRGFDTTVMPALGLPLDTAGCNNCGKCADSCPTGAILKKGERYYLKPSL